MDIEQKLGLIELLDIPILSHGFAPHMRDYQLVIESATHKDGPGKFQITFTHCFDLKYKSAFDNDLLKRSWSDKLIDYQQWQESGEQNGYVWGVNWANAYPGFELKKDSKLAQKWGNSLGNPMFEMKLETNVFNLSFVFHDFKFEKIGEGTPISDQVIIPLRNFKFKE